MSHAARAESNSLPVEIRSDDVILPGELVLPADAHGVVLFAHGSGSSRHSPRNQYVARTIRDAGVGTLLFDLLTKEEEAVDARTAHLRFDIGMLAQRLVDATEWVENAFAEMRIGYFGSSTGGGAALVAAADKREDVDAVVSRGGRPDLAGDALSRVKASTLLIVGGLDYPVIDMNRWAYARLKVEKELVIVPGASHLFEEPGTLERVAQLAADWFQTYLNAGEADDLSRSVGRR